MSEFIIANLGDATAFTVSSTTVLTSGNVLSGGFIFVNNTSGAAITLTLASALTPFAMIKDIAGNANVYPITILFSGGIDGGTTTKLVLAYQWAWLSWNGTDYSVIG